VETEQIKVGWLPQVGNPWGLVAAQKMVFCCRVSPDFSWVRAAFTGFRGGGGGRFGSGRR
jgi:hypothetical protein